MTLILTIKNCLPYFDTEFIRQTFDKLEIGEISSIDTEMVILKERSPKGNKLHDTKKTYYKNVYITYSKVNEDKESIKHMLEQFSVDSYLIVHYSDDNHWKVFKTGNGSTFKPIMTFPTKLNINSEK
jgi:hypothetical protein